MPGAPIAPRPSPARTLRRGVFLSLGSNVGDRTGHLKAALAGLAEHEVQPVGCSSIYRSAPLGGPPQADFLNLVVEAETGLDPREVLDACQRVERWRGRDRRREQRWGPRPLDIDLALFRDRVTLGEDLSVPHPRLHLRRFVLVPLAELAPETVHPLERCTVRELLDRCPDRSRVAREGPPFGVRR